MTVTTQVLGRVLVVRLDRPAERNAIDAETTAGIDAAMDRLEDDPRRRPGDPGCGLRDGQP